MPSGRWSPRVSILIMLDSALEVATYIAPIIRAMCFNPNYAG